MSRTVFENLKKKSKLSKNDYLMLFDTSTGDIGKMFDMMKTLAEKVSNVEKRLDIQDERLATLDTKVDKILEMLEGNVIEKVAQRDTLLNFLKSKWLWIIVIGIIALAGEKLLSLLQLAF